jgi:hypothetical protein
LFLAVPDCDFDECQVVLEDQYGGFQRGENSRIRKANEEFALLKTTKKTKATRA